MCRYVLKVLNFLTFDITHIIAKAARYKLYIYPGASEINLADEVKINQYQTTMEPNSSRPRDAYIRR